MAGGRGHEATVEEVETRRGSNCSPIVCILSVCLVLVLVALIVVTGLHTHTKLQEGSDDNENEPLGCLVAKTGLRGPCRPQRLNFTVEVGAGGGGGGTCADWYRFACPAASAPKRNASVSYAQLLLIGVARTACSGEVAGVDRAMQKFFNVTRVQDELVNPTFGC